MDKWPAYAKLSTVAPAGHLSIASQHPQTPSRGALSSPRGVAIAREMGGAVASDLTSKRRTPTRLASSRCTGGVELGVRSGARFLGCHHLVVHSSEDFERPLTSTMVEDLRRNHQFVGAGGRDEVPESAPHCLGPPTTEQASASASIARRVGIEPRVEIIDRRRQLAGAAAAQS